MATGETARLIAALELQDKFSKTADNANRKLGTLEGTLRTTGQRAGVFSTAVGTALGIGLERAVRAGVGFLTSQVTSGIDALYELESVTTATNTVLDSTRGVSGQTADGIRRMSEEFESLNATMDDKVIQSGANMLLTFTNIREKAFEPALEAALNMNEAMGGREEGLQSTIIQVGKALNDPIRGVTALRRVGVQLSKQQEDQIKTLVEQNDLYGAQQIILDELTTQFGGRFAAAGKTAEGSQARLRDTVEDLQKKLAGPLLPAIDRARDKLIDLFSSPAALAAADQLGQAIAGLASEENLNKLSGFIEQGLGKLSEIDLSGVGSGLSGAFDTMASLPWDAIGSAFELMGSGARAALDIFTSMPEWVQTAVLTGWGLNKLTGGAVSGLIGQLASGLIKGVLNMNAGVVNVNAAVVNGGPGGVPGVPAPGGGGFLGGLAGGLAVGAGVAATGVAAVEVKNFMDMRSEATGYLEGVLDNMPHQTGAEIDESISRIQSEIDKERPFLEGILFNTNVKPQLEDQIAELQNLKTSQERAESAIRDATPWQQRNVQAIHDFNASEGTRFANLGAKQDNVAGAVRGQNGVLNRIANKDTTIRFSPTINVPVSVSATVLNNQVYRRTVVRNGGSYTGSGTVR